MSFGFDLTFGLCHLALEVIEMPRVIFSDAGKAKGYQPDYHQKTMVQELVNPGLGSRFLQFRISKMRPGGRDEFHAHPDSEQIMYGLRGRGKVVVGRKTYTLSKDKFLFIPAGVRHHVENNTKGLFHFIILWALPPKPVDWVPSK